MLATRKHHTICEWWQKWPHANVGGVVGPGRVVLDIDPRNGGDFRLQSLEEKHGPLPHTVEVHTAGGGRHLYFTGNQKGKRDIARGVELLGEDCNVVLVGSIATNGREYEYELSSPGLTKIAPAPDWLRQTDTSPEDKDSGAPKPVSTGARATTWPLTPPHPLFSLPAYIPNGERNSTLTKQAGLLRYQGKEEPEIASLLSQTNSERCSPPLPEQEIKKIARSIGKKPPGKGRSTQEVEKARAIAGELATLACSLRWPGRQGASQRAVLLAFLSYALEAGSTLLTISVRQIAERAGLWDHAAYQAILSLRKKGWLTLVQHSFGDRPNKYALRQPGGLTTTTAQEAHIATGGVDLLLSWWALAEDAFRWTGLGKNAPLVYGQLNEKPIKFTNLAASLNVPKSTLKRILKRLGELGLAKNGPDGWYRGESSLGDVAKDLGTAGKAQEQRHQYEQEREEYQRSLTRRRNPVGVHSERKVGLLVTVPRERAGEQLRYAVSFKKRPEPNAPGQGREKGENTGIEMSQRQRAVKVKRGVKNA